jgi:hypothetical protein
VRPETVPLILVALLLVSAQPGVESFSTIVGGSQDIDADLDADAVLVVDGNATVPEGTQTNATLYVLDGTLRIDGTVRGSITQLAGRVVATPSARVTGRLRAFGGTREVTDGARVPVDAVAEPLTTERTPAEAVGFFLVQAAGLAVLGFLFGRRYGDLLANVAHSIRHHPTVSGTVGLLATVTLLALFVFMAFTIVLLPVSVLGLLAGLLVFLYGYIATGFLLGQWLASYRADRVPGFGADGHGAHTAAGTVLFLLLSELFGFVPVVGGIVPVVVLLVAVGAVVVTYFGLRQFEPPTLSPVE